jgi:hypothetical protein
MHADSKFMIARTSGAIYSVLLILYPRELRREFGAEMVEVFEAGLRGALVKRDTAKLILFWGLAVWELVTVAVPSRLANSVVIAGAVSFLVSSALFLVFFRAVQ